MGLPHVAQGLVGFTGNVERSTSAMGQVSPSVGSSIELLTSALVTNRSCRYTANMSKRVKAASKGDPSKAIGYLRVSTDEQALGLDAQRAAIEAFAKSHGVTVVGFEQDQGVSGATDITARPGLLVALAKVKAVGAGLLIVAKRDRLARDVFNATTIERAALQSGATVVCADGIGNGDTPADQLMRNILDASAAFERALIGQRTKSALQVKKSRGERVGGLPFGFAVSADGKTLERVEAEQTVIAAAKALRANGLSLRKVSAELAGRGMFARSGRMFDAMQVARFAA